MPFYLVIQLVNGRLHNRFIDTSKGPAMLDAQIWIQEHRKHPDTNTYSVYVLEFTDESHSLIFEDTI